MAPLGAERHCAGARIRLDLGCGHRKIRGCLGVDSEASPTVDVLADINRGLPFMDNSVDEIYVYHILEHLDDFLGAMAEIWRVCQPGGLVFVKVPHAASPYVTWKDPTHRRGLFIATFAYFDDTYLEGAFFGYYSKARFRIERARLNFTTSRPKNDTFSSPSWPRRVLSPLLEAFANGSRRAQYICERFWGPLVGFEEAVLVLRAVKE